MSSMKRCEETCLSFAIARESCPGQSPSYTCSRYVKPSEDWGKLTGPKHNSSSKEVIILRRFCCCLENTQISWWQWLKNGVLEGGLYCNHGDTDDARSSCKMKSSINLGFWSVPWHLLMSMYPFKQHISTKSALKLGLRWLITSTKIHFLNQCKLIVSWILRSTSREILSKYSNFRTKNENDVCKISAMYSSLKVVKYGNIPIYNQARGRRWITEDISFLIMP